MKLWLHKVEFWIDKLITPLLFILFFIIIVEIFFHEKAVPYALHIDVFDGFIIAVFAIDLSFKYVRVKNIPKFFRKYWIEIIATIPIYLVFRAFELFYVAEQARGVQSLVHTGIGVEEEALKIAREAERAGRITRTERLLKFFRIGRGALRLPRFLKAWPFYEKPSGRHHVHER